jgi:NitT/TauT family transport system substrate-binding protein
MNLLKKALVVVLAGFVVASFSSNAARAEPLKIGYSDWPGFTIFEVAKQKEWFKEAGLDVDLVWFDYLPSLDAFAAGKIDAVTVVATDALVNGANGAKSKIIALLDYSDGSDMIIGKPGIESIKDLKGQKVGIEATLVEHLLLLEALKQNGMSQSDVEIVNTATNETPQTLASGKVAAVGAWYPVSSQVLKQVPGSKKLFTSADAKGLIYDVLAVNPVSFAKRKDDWTKVVQIFYKCVDYINDPANTKRTSLAPIFSLSLKRRQLLRRAMASIPSTDPWQLAINSTSKIKSTTSHRILRLISCRASSKACKANESPTAWRIEIGLG